MLLLLYVILVVLVVLPVYRAATSPLRGIPGPLLARVTRLWYLVCVARGDFEATNRALHRRYGPIVRVAPGIYSIDIPGDAVTTVYGPGARVIKSAWYEAWERPNPIQRSLFSERVVKRHAQMRRRFQSLFSMKNLLSYEGYVDKCTDLLLQRLDEFADRKGDVDDPREGSIDVLHWFQCFAFDVIGDMTYSARFGFLDHGRDANGLLAALQLKLTYSTLADIFPELHTVMYTVMDWLGVGGAAGISHLANFVRRRTSQRRKERTAAAMSAQEGKPSATVTATATETAGDVISPQDFLDKLLDQHEREPETITDHHIFLMGMSNITAGADTTAISLAAIVYYLLRSPAALARLRAEAEGVESDEAARTEKRRRASPQHVRFKDAQAMPYLQAVIKEAMRLHAANGLPLWRDVAADEGIVLGGHHFPRGSTVGLNIWCAHYNESVFGEDADSFRPERWLEKDEEKLKKMNAYYLPFGLGARACIGRPIALMEMSKLMALLVTRYDLEAVDGHDGWKRKNAWFVRPIGFRVKVRWRA